MSEWVVPDNPRHEGAIPCRSQNLVPFPTVGEVLGEGQGGVHEWVGLVDRLAWTDPAGLVQLPVRLQRAGLRVRDVLAELPSDESLALLIKLDCLRGEAFEELFVRRYARYLLRWFGHWCQDKELAADLTQQLFCNFFETHLDRFDPSRSFRAYLYQAARNLFRDQDSRRKESAPLDLAPEPAANNPAPDHMVAEAELDQRIKQALQTLADRERFVMQATLDEQPAVEIAQLLKIEVREVYALLYAARRHMEKALELPSQKRPYRKTQHKQPHRVTRETKEPSNERDFPPPESRTSSAIACPPRSRPGKILKRGFSAKRQPAARWRT